MLPKAKPNYPQSAVLRCCCLSVGSRHWFDWEVGNFLRAKENSYQKDFTLLGSKEFAHIPGKPTPVLYDKRKQLFMGDVFGFRKYSYLGYVLLE